MLWDAVGLNKIKMLLCCDHKMNNIVLGIQSHGCKYPCHICTALNPKKAGVEWEKGDLRTLGSIRSQCTDWISSGAVTSRASGFQSCTAWPLFDDPDDTLVLSICPMSELHLLLRVFNHIFKHFALESAYSNIDDQGDQAQYNQRNQGSIAESWAVACGAIQKDYHGKVFNGNNCSRLMSPYALHKLEQVLPLGPLLGYLDCFQKFASLKQACFGKSLSPNYGSRIKDFKQSYLNLNINVTPCAHILFQHIPAFIAATVGDEKRGLGFYSEQAFEALHSVVGKTLERFPANQLGDKFACRALRAVTYLNSKHI